jgi:hypothetical protein
MASKCPKCEAFIDVVNIEPVKLTTKTKSILHGISYFCPNCQSVLSVSVDYIALQKDSLNKIEALVKKWH